MIVMNCSIAEIIKYMPLRLRNIFLNMEIGILEHIREIRLKTMCPIIVLVSNKLYSVSMKSKLTDLSEGVIVYAEDVEYTYNMLTCESVYAYNEQIINCYVIAAGGHRVGLSGSAVTKNGEIVGMKEVNGLYFRIAQEYIGCSNTLFPKILVNGSVMNTIIASPPGRGKTTVLRDAACKLSKMGFKVSIIDERHEIAAQSCGYSTFDIGYCDVLDGFPKAEGIERAVRTLSPDVIVFDELGNSLEAEAIATALNCGVSFITSAHAKSLNELLSRPVVRKLIDIKAVDVVVSYDMGKVNEVKYLKGECDVKGSVFELDLRHMYCNGSN